MNKLIEGMYRKEFGLSREELFHRPKLKDAVAHAVKESLTNFPDKIIHLGHSNEEEIYLTQEDRESHIHILGAPGEGKSKFLELLVRSDITNGYGACLLDPSENGDTASKVLKYCASIGFEKVCLINPVDFLEFNKVPVFNPIKYNAPATVSVGNVMDALKVLWNTKDFADTPRIQKYATALLHALHASQSTIVESKYFLTRTHFASEREALLAGLQSSDLHRQHLTSAYQTLLTFEQFQSTVNRFSVFQDPTLRLLLGSKMMGVPFHTLITEGWLILVNLDPQSVWGTEQIQQRLIGTLIINEVVYAIHRLRESGWQGVYYLYIDEVGDYATSKLAYILDKKRKTGLRFTVAHQRFEQIEDRNVQSSVRGSAKTKALFYTPNKTDREIMMKDMGYGGSLPDREVSYILGELQKQHASLRIGKKSPVITRLKDVPDTQISPAALRAFKEKLYSYEWFHSPNTINQEISDRFKTEVEQPTRRTGVSKRGNLEGPVGRPVPDNSPAGSNRPPREGPTYFDTQVPENPPVRSRVRRRSKATPDNAKRGTRKKASPKKWVGAYALVSTRSQEAY